MCQTITLAEIQRGLAEREQLFKTIDLRFDRHVVQRLQGPPGANTEMLAEPLLMKRMHRYIIDGTRWSLLQEGESLELATGNIVEFKDAVAFDGKRATGYHRVAKTKYGTTIAGAIADASDHGQIENPAQSLDSLPVALSFRPLSWGLGIEFARQARTRTDRGVINGRSHVILELQSSPKSKQEVWLDWDRGCLIARYVTFIQGVRRSQLDISHSRRPGFAEWLISGWRFVHTTAKGEIDMSHDVTVTSLALNEPITPTIWNVEFPGGTLVDDTIANQQYIVRDDGSRRIILPEERKRGATYADYLVTETGEAPRIKRSGHIGILSYSVPVVLGTFVVAIAVWWFRVSRRARSRP